MGLFHSKPSGSRDTFSFSIKYKSTSSLYEREPPPERAAGRRRRKSTNDEESLRSESTTVTTSSTRSRPAHATSLSTNVDVTAAWDKLIDKANSEAQKASTSPTGGGVVGRAAYLAGSVGGSSGGSNLDMISAVMDSRGGSNNNNDAGRNPSVKTSRTTNMNAIDDLISAKR
eukprot:GEZU01035745.1.p1 GENE.GEZU01035745.1~~GEZU01035745.1.p1  ORF type:complete len:172 (+),score=21.49 GEZU01035745.1:99-614(+)